MREKIWCKVFSVIEAYDLIYWLDLLPLQDLLDRNQLHLLRQQFFFHFQNNLVQTSKDRRSAVHNEGERYLDKKSPVRIRIASAEKAFHNFFFKQRKIKNPTHQEALKVFLRQRTIISGSHFYEKEVKKLHFFSTVKLELSVLSPSQARASQK